MKRLSAVPLFAIAVVAGACTGLWSAQPVRAQSEGWVTLFDGKSLDHFNKVSDANWRLEEGAVVADKGVGFLVSKESYTDFQMRAEFWADEDANSGIFIRCTDQQKISTETAYEVNIYDKRPEPI
jgi:hypothetical protein